MGKAKMTKALMHLLIYIILFETNHIQEIHMMEYIENVTKVILIWLAKSIEKVSMTLHKKFYKVRPV